MANHPNLAKKLKLLYSLRLNSKISSHTELAAEIGISKQAISRWMHGSDTRHGDHVPIAQLQNLADLFQVKEHWFAKSYEEFERLLFGKLENQEEPPAPRPEKISISQLPTTSSVVFGREAELATLNAAWSDNSTNILQIVAFGGVGKSCLTNYWLANLNEKNYAGANRVYAWSFYWQGASSDIKSTGDFFIEHALDWFGDEDSAKGTPWAKASRLAKLIRQSKTLLVLDGLEPLQCPPGPNAGQIQNPAVSFLIKELAAENNGLCIITTRLPVAELNSFSRPRAKTIQLLNLSVEASVKLLKVMGIEGSSYELNEAVSKYSCHPLSLTLLGGYLKIVHQGDIEQVRLVNSLFDEESHSNHAKNLMHGYLSWFQGKPESEILSLIGLIDRATSIEEIKTLASQGSSEGLVGGLQKLTHSQWCYAVERLNDAQLISIQLISGSRVIECHPLVKEYVVMQLKELNYEKWKEGNRLLFRYYQMSVPENPENRSELDYLFRAVIHGTRALMYREAFHLYFFQIKNGFTMLSKGSHYADEYCISAFFAKPWTTPVSELSEDESIHLFSSLAVNQMSLGRIGEAIIHAEKSLAWFVANERWIEASAFAGPYISMLIAVGRLHDVDAVMKNLDPCVENTHNTVLIAMGLIFQAYVDYLKGNNYSAAKKFELADAEITKPEPGAPISFPTVSSYYCKFLLETGHQQQALDRLVKTFGWRKRKTWQVAIDTPSIYASDLLILGLTFLARDDLINAKKYLDRQVELFRSSDEWLYLPTGLHSRARYFIKVEDFQAAIADLDEALQIAQRTGAVFGEWESYINFAHLYQARNQVSKCKEYLRKAAELPNMAMYRFRDKEVEELQDFVTTAAS